MKMPLEWHKQCYRNQKSHLEEKERELERLIVNVSGLQDEVRFYFKQIESASKKGIDGFDAGKFMRKRNRN